jgi:hypothetical protein
LKFYVYGPLKAASDVFRLRPSWLAKPEYISSLGQVWSDKGVDSEPGRSLRRSVMIGMTIQAAGAPGPGGGGAEAPGGIGGWVTVVRNLKERRGGNLKEWRGERR